VLNLRTIYLRSLQYYWRAHLAAALGVIVGTAALTGALLVGDSMRGSLRDTGLDRLGKIDYAVTAPRFFRTALADELAETDSRVCPIILTRGSGANADTLALAGSVNIHGVEDRFFALAGDDTPFSMPEIGRVVILNNTLAQELGAAPGDDVFLRMGKPGDISTETILGDKDDAALTLRLTVAAVVPAEDLGAFSVNPRQGTPRCAYVPLATLQRALERPGRVNTLLIDTRYTAAAVAGRLKKVLELDDVGLRVRADERGYVVIESDAFLIAPELEKLVREAAAGVETMSVLAYLANRIEVEGRPEKFIPYSTIAAIDSWRALHVAAAPRVGWADRLETGPTEVAAGASPAENANNVTSRQILLNQWAAEDLEARPGDRIRLTYYLSGPLGELSVEHSTFELAGVAPLQAAAADPGFTPIYPGVTDADRLTDWDPPFPIDLKQIRDKDEEYWDLHGATPKAFITLADGRALWTAESKQHGRLTSLRLYPHSDETCDDVLAAFEAAFARQLDPSRAGFDVDPIRERFTAASKGSTDFGGLFIGFSFFLIISAALLAALMFRLGVERRSGEVGLLLATGFTPGQVARLLLAEGVALASVAGVAGLVVARGYAWLMIVGLRTWWADAANMPSLRLYETETSYVIGYVAGLVVAGTSIAWSLRGLTRMPPRALLSGAIQSGRPAAGGRRKLTAIIVSLVALIGVGVFATLNLFTDALAQSLTFFLGGAALLVACLAGMAAWLDAEPRAAALTPGFGALVRLGMRNARRRVGRSLLTIGLVASATFTIAALQTMRLDAPAAAGVRESGTGGFALRAEAATGLPYDLNTPDGRASLNVAAETASVLAEAAFIPFRLREGDDTSCLNLYTPSQPRVIGASDAMIQRGGFLFTKTLAQTEQERLNPWTLLHREFDDGAVPVIADEGAVLWQLHSKLGGDLHVTDERGRDVVLRIVAMIKWSILQSEVVIAERRFKDLFPSIAGHGFFLIDAPPEHVRQLEQTLERKLSDFGFAAVSAERHLAEMFAVQNTYLSTFQTVGGLGLLLGTFGLAVVMLRNIWERRGELALMQALGFSRAALISLVMSENVFLIGAGMLSGLLSAGLVILPHLLSRIDHLPWLSLLAVFMVIFTAGVFAGLAALIPALRTRLLPALRAE